MAQQDDERQPAQDWDDAVNMTPSALEEWLDTDESRSVGDSSGGGES